MENKTLNPLENRVVILPTKSKEQTAGGIYIPNSAQGKPNEGIVKAVGPGRILDNGDLVEMTVKIGDTVVYPDQAGIKIKMNNEEYLIIAETHILATKG